MRICFNKATFNFLVMTALLLSGSAAVHGQKNLTDYLIETTGNLSECDEGLRLDNLMNDIRAGKGARAVVIVYDGVQLPGNRRNTARWKMKRMRSFAYLRNYNPAKFKFVFGGLKPKHSYEFFLLPANTGDPLPSNTILAPKIPKNSTFQWSYRILDYDFGSTLLQSGNDEVSDPDSPKYVDSNREERDAVWLDEELAEFVLKDDKRGLVLFFYADPENTQIQSVKTEISKGIRQFSSKYGVAKERIVARYGGVRDEFLADFDVWVVYKESFFPKPSPKPREQR